MQNFKNLGCRGEGAIIKVLRVLGKTIWGFFLSSNGWKYLKISYSYQQRWGYLGWDSHSQIQRIYLNDIKCKNWEWQGSQTNLKILVQIQQNEFKANIFVMNSFFRSQHYALIFLQDISLDPWVLPSYDNSLSIL